MPAKMYMNLMSGRPTSNQILLHNINQANIANAPKASSMLGAPMISRIHTTKPGCGSCGRH
jgi:hypothetical protein